MIVTTYRIPYKLGDVIKIRPIFDVHWGSRYCDAKAFKKFLSDGDDNTYFFGGGDLFNSIVLSDSRYEKHDDLSGMEPELDYQYNSFKATLEPYRDQIIGLGRGNHENTVVKKYGTDLVGRLCADLGCTYLGFSGLIRLVLSENGSRGRTVIIRWHHGYGGGARTAGADLTKYSHDMKHWDADIFLYGHVHQKKDDEIPRLGLVGDKLVDKPMLLGICGTFLKTYSDTSDATYSEVKGYAPAPIGGIVVNIKPESKGWVKSWIEKL